MLSILARSPPTDLTLIEFSVPLLSGPQHLTTEASFVLTGILVAWMISTAARQPRPLISDLSGDKQLGDIPAWQRCRRRRGPTDQTWRAVHVELLACIQAKCSLIAFLLIVNLKQRQRTRNQFIRPQSKFITTPKPEMVHCDERSFHDVKQGRAFSAQIIPFFENLFHIMKVMC